MLRVAILSACAIGAISAPLSSLNLPELGSIGEKIEAVRNGEGLQNLQNPEKAALMSKGFVPVDPNVVFPEPTVEEELVSELPAAKKGRKGNGKLRKAFGDRPKAEKTKKTRRAGSGRKLQTALNLPEGGAGLGLVNFDKIEAMRQHVGARISDGVNLPQVGAGEEPGVRVGRVHLESVALDQARNTIKGVTSGVRASPEIQGLSADTEETKEQEMLLLKKALPVMMALGGGKGALGGGALASGVPKLGQGLPANLPALSAFEGGIGGGVPKLGKGLPAISSLQEGGMPFAKGVPMLENGLGAEGLPKMGSLSKGLGGFPNLGYGYPSKLGMFGDLAEELGADGGIEEYAKYGKTGFGGLGGLLR